MKLRESQKTCTQCFQRISFSMLFQRSRVWKPLEVFATESRTTTRRRRHKATTYKRYDYPSTFRKIITMAMFLQSVTVGQMELGYGDLLYPDRVANTGNQRVSPDDSLRQIRSLTTRAVITIQGRSQRRYLTVFRASESGHVEFGFPTAANRPSGSLEIFDGTRISSSCCPPGIRIVALRHICSDSYLAVDTYGQMRACQLSDDGSFTPLRREQHCLDGEVLHTCTDSPYFYLDSISKMITINPPPSAGPGQPGQYKLRFERKTPRSKDEKRVFYAAVSSTTWQFRLRAQNSVLRRATTQACQVLWRHSVNVLFERTVVAYKRRRIRRNFRDIQRLCDINPVSMRDHISNDIDSRQFTETVEKVWKSNPKVERLASSVAWSRMSLARKKVFVFIAGTVVKDFLRDSLLEVTNLYCMDKTQWGRLSRESKLRYLDNLTLSWIQENTEATQLVIGTIEKSFDSRTTTFLIKEGG